jgi:hypothetical protein
MQMKALLESHVSVNDCPGSTCAALAAKLAVVVEGFTVTVT